jgi:hypothetical protein
MQLDESTRSTLPREPYDLPDPEDHSRQSDADSRRKPRGPGRMGKDIKEDRRNAREDRPLGLRLDYRNSLLKTLILSDALGNAGVLFFESHQASQCKAAAPVMRGNVRHRPSASDGMAMMCTWSGIRQ